MGQSDSDSERDDNNCAEIKEGKSITYCSSVKTTCYTVLD